MNIPINKLFLPSKAIRTENSEVFVGRQDVISEAIEAVSIAGSTLLIYGERGIGKTSFAWQISNILSGQNNIIGNNKVFKSDPAFNSYYTVWLECKEYMYNIEGVILHLLNNDIHFENELEKNLFNLFPEVFKNENIKNVIKETSTIDLKIFKKKWEFGEKPTDLL